MGFLSHLFKVKPQERRSPFTPKPSPAAADPALSPDEDRKAHQASGAGRRISLGAEKPAVGSRGETEPPSSDRASHGRLPISEKDFPAGSEVTLELGDILTRIPPHLLKPGSLDSTLPFKLPVAGLFPGISRGRATILVSTLARLCPEVFREQARIDQTEISLPLQKLVKQISAFQQPRPQPQTAETRAPFSNLIVERKPDAAPEPEPSVEHKPDAAPEPEPSAASALIPRSSWRGSDLLKSSDLPGEASASPAADPSLRSARSPAKSSLASAALARRKSLLLQEKIHLGLAVIVRALPENSPLARLRGVAEQTRITLPFGLIEPQIAKGKVEVSARELVAALPEHLRHEQDSAIPDFGVTVPLDEIFLNLPGGAGSEPPAPAPVLPETPPVAFEPRVETSPVEPPAVPKVEEEKPLPPPAEVRLEIAEPPPAETKIEANIPAQEQTAPAVAEPPPPAPEPALPSSEAPPVPAPLPEKPEPAVEMPVSPPAAPVSEAIQQKEEEKESAPPAAPAPVPEVIAEIPSKPPVPAEPVVSTEPPAEPPAPAQTPAPVPEPQPASITAPPPPPILVPATSQTLHIVSPGGHASPSLILPPPLLSKAPPPIGQSGAARPGLPVSHAAAPIAYDPSVLQSLFMTDQELDLQKIATHVAALPGMSGCVFLHPSGLVLAGDIPADFDFKSFREYGPELCAAAGAHARSMNLAGMENITLNCDPVTASFFADGPVCLCLFHSGRGFVPGVREKIRTVIQQVARMP